MVKKLVLFTFFVFSVVLSFSQLTVFQSRGVPANPNSQVEYKQPDGHMLTISMNGDAVVHWATSVDGYTLVLGKDDGFEYAIKDNDGNLVPSGILAHNPGQRTPDEMKLLNTLAKDLRYSPQQVELKVATHQFFARKAQLPKAFPSTGNRKIVVILANFSNTTTTYTQTQFNNLLNQANYNNTGSFKDFYYENSYGQLTITATVTPWVKVPNTHDYYGPESKWGEFAYEAVKAADPYVNYAEFDNDGDGVVDGVAIIHQGYGQEESGSTKDIWSHSWQLSSAGYSSTQRKFDNVYVDAYTVQPEKQGTGMMQIGVLCHEVGHNMGAPDYYDTDYSTNGQYDGTGKWDVMASGSYNGSPAGCKPAHHNPFTKCYIYGWATPTTLTSAGTITVYNSAQNKSFYRINTTTNNEYFLIENRQKVGFDANVPGSGLLIYRVDGNWINQYMASNKINISSHQGMYPVPANATTAIGVISGNGAVSTTSCPWPGATGKTQFTDATTPSMKSWAGAATNKPITNITISNGVATFTFMGGSTTPSAPSATTNAATNITSSSATLNATVNNNNATSTTVTFEWGTTTSLGNTVTASPSSVTGNTNTAVTANLTDLQPNTTYYFRVKAVNSAGTTYGSILSFKTNSTSVTYCTSKGNSTAYEWIDYVELGAIKNSTSANGGYGNFTSLTPATLVRGSSYTIYFSAGFSGTAYTEYWRIYIDWNKDGDFLDSGEQIVSGSSSSSGTLYKTFTVPTTAALGTTRLRVVMSDNSSTTSCGTYSYGETEDYTVNIVASATGAPFITLGEQADELGNEADYLSVFPIPAKDFVTVKINTATVDTKAKAVIYNLQGQNVAEYILTSPEQQIPVADLKPGAYTIKVFDGNKEIIKSFMKY